ncbi:MAG: asparagine synthase (glutamine-hydrolyzing) [Flavobacteriia bacterium]|nr:asparagine synthase (glutamine-hydrolyzing) [Flavobacteriia bacterium]
MCGITGFADWRKKSSEDILKRMNETLNHRGPDSGSDIVFNTDTTQIGLAHKRLAIIDVTETGKQPMHFQHYCITYNGEIYNFPEIKKELSILGHQFIGHSDTEMILHAYAQWGEKCIEKFIGMFAFVLFDQDKNELFCARDRAGIKPFFYYFDNDLFLFASELKAFHQHPDFQKEIDLDAVAAFMQYGNVPSSMCIFKKCHKLKPGHTLKITLNKTEKKETKQYWNVYDAYNKPKIKSSFEEAKIETEKILKSACEYRMVSDVPVGVFLSGGYDSACVTALLQKDRSEKLKTYTIGVPDIGLNEAPYAKDVANHLGTEHTEIYCTEKEAINLVPELAFYYDEPFADSSALPTTLVSKLARKDVTVALSADAGDEIFAGYNRYDYLLRYGKKMEKIPGFARNTLTGLMNVIPSNKIPILKNKYNFHNRYEKLKTILKDPSSQRIMLTLSQQYTEKQLRKLLLFRTQENGTAYLSNELKTENYSPLAYMMAIDYQTYLVDDILQKVDRASMTVSLEGREPFLDHRVIEWAATLPDTYKYFDGNKKYIIKEIVHQYIPKKLMDRPKMGFAIPIANWMTKELKDYLESYINEKTIRDQGIFRWETIDKLKKDFFSGKKEYDMKMWYLLMFQTWYDRWMK